MTPSSTPGSEPATASSSDPLHTADSAADTATYLATNTATDTATNTATDTASAAAPEAPVSPPPRFRPVPWSSLETPQDVELWIDAHNQSLQENIGPQETGYGVCFTLAVGGNIYMQTTGDAILLDVDGDASWVAPLLTAATGAEPPVGQLWVLPEDRLVQLILGLSSLIATTTLIVGHRFGSRNRKMAA